MASDTPNDDVGDQPPQAHDRTPVPPPPPAPPRAQETNEQVRNWTMAAHGSALVAAFVALAFIGPLVVWLVRKEVDPISAAHAKEALNFNLSVLIYGLICFALVFVLIGIPLLLALGVFWIVNVIRAMIAVSAGQTFRYPMTMRMID